MYNISVFVNNVKKSLRNNILEHTELHIFCFSLFILNQTGYQLDSQTVQRVGVPPYSHAIFSYYSCTIRNLFFIMKIQIEKLCKFAHFAATALKKNYLNVSSTGCCQSTSLQNDKSKSYFKLSQITTIVQESQITGQSI